MTKLKNTIDGFNSRIVEADKWKNELKDRTVKPPITAAKEKL